ncbi:MAG: hypothetical protein NVSMB21_08750 [Vulcanimicrobiaceae bacterium]
MSFFVLPLYGRQLARAHAIAPSLGALSLPLGYVAGAVARGVPPDREGTVAAVLAVLVTTLVTLSGTFRDGRERWLYAGLAVGAGSTIALAGAGGRPYLWLTVVLSVVEGFGALRAFGETLARYDPLPE